MILFMRASATDGRTAGRRFHRATVSLRSEPCQCSRLYSSSKSSARNVAVRLDQRLGAAFGFLFPTALLVSGFRRGPAGLVRSAALRAACSRLKIAHWLPTVAGGEVAIFPLPIQPAVPSVLVGAETSLPPRPDAVARLPKRTFRNVLRRNLYWPWC